MADDDQDDGGQEAGPKRFLLRLDPRTWAEVRAWAEEDMRSVNGQIEYLLNEALRRRRGQAKRPPSP